MNEDDIEIILPSTDEMQVTLTVTAPVVPHLMKVYDTFKQKDETVDAFLARALNKSIMENYGGIVIERMKAAQQAHWDGKLKQLSADINKVLDAAD